MKYFFDLSLVIIFLSFFLLIAYINRKLPNDEEKISLHIAAMRLCFPNEAVSWNKDAYGIHTMCKMKDGKIKVISIYSE